VFTVINVDLDFTVAITKSPHLSRSCTNSCQSCAPRSSKSFSTTSIHLFRGRPHGLLPFSYEFSTIQVNASLLRSITCPSHFILWLSMNPLIVTIFFSSWLNFLRFFRSLNPWMGYIFFSISNFQKSSVFTMLHL